MGKHEPMSAKAIAIKIKAKGLQKIKYYCEMCKKQCRDDNGFKCHIQSESHQRQALIVAENPEKFVGEYSQQFMDGFMYLLRTRYRSSKVLANTIFQEYIKERDHIHLNGTRWTTLTEFAQWLHGQGLVIAEDSERGVMITYIDKDPEKMKRLELENQSSERAKKAAERNRLAIERQMDEAKKMLKTNELIRADPEPIPILIKAVNREEQQSSKSKVSDKSSSSSLEPGQPETSSPADVGIPQFNFKPLEVKTLVKSNYKPPPPKKKVSSKDGNKSTCKTLQSHFNKSNISSDMDTIRETRPADHGLDSPITIINDDSIENKLKANESVQNQTKESYYEVKHSIDDEYDVMGREEQELARRQYPDDDTPELESQKEQSSEYDDDSGPLRDCPSNVNDCSNRNNISDHSDNNSNGLSSDQTNKIGHTKSSNGHSNNDEPEQMRKLFIGGLDYKTSEATLKQHFEMFGEVIDCIVMRDPQSKRSRGFGFVTYKCSSMVDRAQEARPHEVEGREVQSKRAISREDSGKPEAQATVKKVYLGGLSDDVEESELRAYFKDFGNIVNINIVSHKDTGKRRGFAFVEFDDYDPVDKIVLKQFHTIKDKRIEAKKAVPKIEMDARRRVDPRMAMAGSIIPMSGPALEVPRGRGNRGNDTTLWDSSHGPAGYQAGYSCQIGFNYPPHYHSSSTHYNGNNWMLNQGGAGAAAGFYGCGLRGSQNSNTYGRIAYTPTGGNWTGSNGSDYGNFANYQAGNTIGGIGGASGPVRINHQYRWNPYGGAHGSTQRGRGHN